MTRRFLIGAMSFIALNFAFLFSQQTCAYPLRAKARAVQHDQEIDQLISQMTLEEKVDMLGGTGFATKPLPRLGIPAIEMTDGPLGVRGAPATAFPVGISMAASFDVKLMHDVAAAIAEESRYFGKHMLLGPCVGLSRHPFGGRNFECFGEDPFLSSLLSASYVRSIQSQNVLASVKHFAVNDQEYDRFTVNTKVDTRTLFELHFPQFKAAIDAGVWTVMSSYNKVNGYWASENDFLLNKVLKGMWGFKGFVVSDWESVHSTIPAALNGLDLEMPTGLYLNRSLVDAVRDGRVPEAVINDKIRRIMRAMYGIGLMGNSAPTLPAAKGPESAEHQRLALKLAQDSIVLLKNDGNVLPLSSLRRVAVIGPNAAVARTGAGGSSKVIPYRHISPLDGIKARLGTSVDVRYAIGQRLPGDILPVPAQYLRPAMNSNQRGLKGEYFANTNLAGSPIFSRVDSVVDFDFQKIADPRLKDDFSVRWTGYIQAPVSGVYALKTKSDDGVRLFINGQEVISNWTNHSRTVDTVKLQLVSGQSYEVRLEYYQGKYDAAVRLGWERPDHNERTLAVQEAKAADAAIVVVGLSEEIESEAIDRTTMDLPEGQGELIRAVAAVNPNTVVVVVAGNPVTMSDWLADVKSVLQVWYPGGEGGYAIADVILGIVNPSGKLPVTFLKRWEDSPVYGNYPGHNQTVEYKEGIFLGYRHFDATGIAPHFPFGHGLSYTNFQFDSMQVQPVQMNHGSPQVRVSFRLTNTGSRSGAEVAQLYVGELNPSVERPVRELKGFKKVNLQAGESQMVTFDLNASSFAFFDVATMSWKVNPGAFQIWVGSSSRSLPLSQAIMLQ